MVPYSRHLSKSCNPCVLVIEAAPFFNSPRVAIDPMWIGDSLSARPARTFMSIGALFHTHICPDAVIGLEENQALLDKGIAELSLSGSLQTEAEKLRGPHLFIGLRKRGARRRKKK